MNALKFTLKVQENIELFGGDKNQVTLMGVSSGAASVHLHMLSKQSEGNIKFLSVPLRS